MNGDAHEAIAPSYLAQTARIDEAHTYLYSLRGSTSMRGSCSFNGILRALPEHPEQHLPGQISSHIHVTFMMRPT